jgi:hypothetical protein
MLSAQTRIPIPQNTDSHIPECMDS